MKKFEELLPLINVWFEQKKLNNLQKQKLKFIEEFGELTGAHLKNNEPLKQDGLGDSIVVIIGLAKIKGVKIDMSKFNYYELNEKTFDDTYWGIIDDVKNDRFNKALQGLIYLSSQFLGLAYVECLNIAWNEIKDRQGETVNGSFVKNEKQNK